MRPLPPPLSRFAGEGSSGVIQADVVCHRDDETPLAREAGEGWGRGSSRRAPAPKAAQRSASYSDIPSDFMTSVLMKFVPYGSLLSRANAFTADCVAGVIVPFSGPL